MKVVTAFAVLSLLIGTLVRSEDEKEPKQIEISQLAPSFDGAMGRFGFGPTRGEDSLTGLVIEARGKIRMYPAPKNAFEKGPSYSFIIDNWKGFRIKPTSERP